MTARAVLGVTTSLRGRPWMSRLDQAGEARALAIAQLTGTSVVLSRILAGRGIGPADAAKYLDPSLRDLMPDPGVLADMNRAAARIARAIEARETVAIFGDYDVDGAASAALLAGYLEACDVPYLIHIPDRIFEGYGPNVEAIQALAARGAKLLVTVDCGTTSHAPLEEAKRLGLDPIVLDHHQAPEHLPDAIIVNPNRLDDLSGLGQLCAAGVVFMTLAAVQRNLRASGFFAARPEPDLLAALDLVALATVADVAALTGLNRAFVVKGLAVMRERGRPGLRALFDVAGADGPPSAYHLGYLVGPRINAGGRIGDAALGAKLLGIASESEATEIAATLDRLNRERQAMEAATLEEAEAEALRQVGLQGEGASVIMVAGPDWHPGIVGIIAGRLREKFGRPAFALALANGSATGSGRSVVGVDLGRSVRGAVEAGILVKGGGHAMAAGITVDSARIEAFRAYLETDLAEAAARARAAEALYVDATLTAAGATPALLASLEKAGPYGAGNPEPVFVFASHRLVDAAPVGVNHIRFKIQAGDGATLEGIAFRAGGEPLGQGLLAGKGRPMHLAGTLSLDRYGGRERVKLRLLDAALAG
ncbi:MAG: single-stranded-DNA-specific exonuclease RecJ [Beijerinckiaceae bacterium]|nr:single-stranded-DNA-specific exonuclease RecJ [Beijerinckiaceae bacterium]